MKIIIEGECLNCGNHIKFEREMTEKEQKQYNDQLNATRMRDYSDDPCSCNCRVMIVKNTNMQNLSY